MDIEPNFSAFDAENRELHANWLYFDALYHLCGMIERMEQSKNIRLTGARRTFRKFVDSIEPSEIHGQRIARLKERL